VSAYDAMDQVTDSQVIEFGMRISPFVPDYHQSVTSSVNGGLLFCHVARLLASTPAHQTSKLRVDLILYQQIPVVHKGGG